MADPEPTVFSPAADQAIAVNLDDRHWVAENAQVFSAQPGPPEPKLFLGDNAMRASFAEIEVFAE